MALPLPDPASVIAELQRLLLTGKTFWKAEGLDPLTGCGCYGVVWYAMRHVGIALPVGAEDGAKLYSIVAPPYDAFDVMVARHRAVAGERHVGIFMGPRWGFHCSTSTHGLARFSINHAVWQQLFRHALRYQEFLT